MRIEDPGLLRADLAQREDPDVVDLSAHNRHRLGSAPPLGRWPFHRVPGEVDRHRGEPTGGSDGDARRRRHGIGPAGCRRTGSPWRHDLLDLLVEPALRESHEVLHGFLRLRPRRTDLDVVPLKR